MKIKKGQFSYFQGGIGNTIPARTIEELNELKEIIENSVDLRGIYKTDTTKDKSVYKEHKSKLDYITPTGVYTYRSNSNIYSISRYFTLDIDDKHIPQGATIETVFEALKLCDYVRFMAYSPSGAGIWILVEYHTDLIKHLVESGNYQGFVQKLKAIVGTFSRLVLEKEYGIKSDDCSKVLSQARYIAKSKEVYINEYSKVWTECLQELPEISLKNKKKAYNSGAGYSNTSESYTGDKEADKKILFELADIAESEGIDIFSYNYGTGYHDWQRAAVAIACACGEEGRIIFERLSELRGQDTQAADRDKVTAKYDDALKNGRGEVTMATVFWLFKQALGDDVFKEVVNKHKPKKSLIAANEVIKRAGIDEISKQIEDVVKKKVGHDLSVHKETLAILALVVKYLMDEEIVYCLDDTYFYKKCDGKWKPIDKTDGGGGEFITMTTHLLAKQNGMQLKVKDYTNIIAPLLDIVLRNMIGRRIYEITIENAGIDLDKIMDYTPQYRLEDFMNDLSVDYSYSYIKEDVKKLWTEFFAGIGNVLFKPLRTDKWIGADRVPVLVGKIGIGKTTFVRWFIKQIADSLLPNDIGLTYMAQIENFDAHKRDVAVSMRDNLLILMDDVKEKALNSPEARQLITSAADRMRTLFKSSSETFYRRAHFIATTNHKQIIKEVQNNRRFFPLVLKPDAETGYAFNIRPEFNALDLIIDALQTVEARYEGDFNKLKSELDLITVQVSKEFSSDGDVAQQIEADYLYVDLGALKHKARVEGGIYESILEDIKLTSMRELRDDLKLDKKTIDAAMQSLGIDIVSTSVRVNGVVRKIYGYPIIDRNAEFSDGGIDTKKAYELPDIFKEIGTDFDYTNDSGLF